MDIIHESHEDFLKWIYEKSNSVIKRDTSVLYYDCTNLYFECEKEDGAIVDEVTGEIMCGLRKYGVSKGDPVKDILEVSHNCSKIEDCFLQNKPKIP